MKNYNDAFEDLLGNLVETEPPLRAALIYRLSEPSKTEVDALQAIWPNVPVERKRLLMSRLAETLETSFEVDFSDVALFALQDDDAEVRQRAVETLWENDQPGVMRTFVKLIRDDPDARVRAAAATALGSFVLLGEIEELEETIAKEAEQALLGAYHRADEEIEVRRRALESIGFSSHEEVPILIREAAQHSDPNMKASALFAMGRSSDAVWTPYVIDALTGSEPELCFEAVRAAGEIGITKAVPRLIQFANSKDREIKEMAIWSLGEIGGDEAQGALFALADAETDDDLLEAIEDAINMAALSLGSFGMYVLSSDDDDDSEELEDIDELQDAP
jgi:HEAT repeat protein